MTLNDYVSTHYTEIIKAAKQVAPSHAEDLAHEVILQVYDQDATKVQDLVDTGDLKFLDYQNDASQLQKQDESLALQVPQRRDTTPPTVGALDQGMERARIVRTPQRKMLQTIDEALAEVPWFDAAVFSIYYEEGHSLNSLTKSTGISRHTPLINQKMP